MSSSAYITKIRWGITFLVVLGLHILLASTLLAFNHPTQPIINTPASVVMLEFSPVAETTGHSANAAAVAQQKASLPIEEPDPEVKELPKLEPTVVKIPDPKIALTVKSKEKPKPIKPKVKPKKEPRIEKKELSNSSNNTNKTNAQSVANVSAGGGSGKLSNRNAGAANSNGVSKGVINWRGLLQGHLARYKRYPREASRRRHEGVVQVGFSIDYQGNVTNIKLFKGSGSVFLDKEAVALLRRASPLPNPPRDLMASKNSINLVFPIEFSLRELR